MLDRLASSPSLARGKKRRKATPGTLLNIRAVLRTAPAARVSAFLARAEADGDPLLALWHLDAVYGMRRAELVGLGWDDVDVPRT